MQYLRVAYFITPAPRVGHAQPPTYCRIHFLLHISEQATRMLQRESHGLIAGQECNTSTQPPSSHDVPHWQGLPLNHRHS